jgi:hypothetical protein
MGDKFRRRLAVATVVMLLIGFTVTAGSLVLFARSLNGIRSTFCTYEQGIYTATLTLPQVSGRLAVERSDRELMRQLGCPEQ